MLSRQAPVATTQPRGSPGAAGRSAHAERHTCHGRFEAQLSSLHPASGTLPSEPPSEEELLKCNRSVFSSRKQEQETLCPRRYEKRSCEKGTQVPRDDRKKLAGKTHRAAPTAPWAGQEGQPPASAVRLHPHPRRPGRGTSERPGSGTSERPGRGTSERLPLRSARPRWGSPVQAAGQPAPQLLSQMLSAAGRAAGGRTHANSRARPGKWAPTIRESGLWLLDCCKTALRASGCSWGLLPPSLSSLF